MFAMFGLCLPSKVQGSTPELKSHLRPKFEFVTRLPSIWHACSSPFCVLIVRCVSNICVDDLFEISWRDCLGNGSKVVELWAKALAAWCYYGVVH